MIRSIITDANGRDIREGSAIRVLGLAPGLLDGLADDVVEFLKTAVFMEGEVDEILDGDVSVMLKQSEARYHFIRSPGHLLRVLNEATTPPPSKA